VYGGKNDIMNGGRGGRHTIEEERMDGTKRWYRSGTIVPQIVNIIVMLIAMTVAIVNANTPGTVTADEQAAVQGAVQQAGDAVVTVTAAEDPATAVGAWGALAAAGASIVFSVTSIRRRMKATKTIGAGG
jgi:hypothetical protein